MPLVQSRAASLRRALEREHAANQARRERERTGGGRTAHSPQGRSGREHSSNRDREPREGRQPRSRPEESALAARARRILEEIDAMGMETAIRESETRRR